VNNILNILKSFACTIMNLPGKGIPYLTPLESKFISK